MNGDTLTKPGEIGFHAWALKQSRSLARAAEEGYDVRGAVLDAVAGKLAVAVAEKLGTVAVTLKEDSPAWNQARLETRTPNAQAFAAFDEVQNLLPRIDKPDDVILSLRPVQRYREKTGAPPTTVICVRVWMPDMKERIVIWPIPREKSNP